MERVSIASNHMLKVELARQHLHRTVNHATCACNLFSIGMRPEARPGLQPVLLNFPSKGTDNFAPKTVTTLTPAQQQRANINHAGPPPHHCNKPNHTNRLTEDAHGRVKKRAAIVRS